MISVPEIISGLVAGGGIGGIFVRYALPAILNRNRNGKTMITRDELKDQIKEHRTVCLENLETRLHAGNVRFQTIEKRAEEDRANDERRHDRVMEYLMKIAGEK